MNANRMAPVFAQNQNSGSNQLCTIGRRKMPAKTRNTIPNAGNVYLSIFRAGLAAWYRAVRPAITKITLGRRFDPYCAGQRGSQPPRNSSVAMELTVTMFRYSAMKKEANFMLLYST